MDPESAGGAESLNLVTRFGSRPLSLNERLEAIAAEARSRDPDAMGVVDRFVARLAAACTGADAPAVGDALPPFMMPDHDGTLIALADLLQGDPLVVAFHRGHWCPYCRTTLATLAGLQDQIAPARIVAISAETSRFTRRIRAETGARFAFLSDIDADYAAALGLAITIESPLRELLEHAGKRVPDFQGSRGWILPVPAIFVLDRDGVVQARHVDPDYRRRMEVEELLAAVRSSGS